MPEKTKRKPVTRPYISLDGRSGEFEGKFEEWYLAQDARSTKMKEILAVGFAIHEASPMLFSTLLGGSLNSSINLDYLLRAVTMVSEVPKDMQGLTVKSPAKEDSVKQVVEKEKKPINTLMKHFAD